MHVTKRTVPLVGISSNYDALKHARVARHLPPGAPLFDCERRREAGTELVSWATALLGVALAASLLL